MKLAQEKLALAVRELHVDEDERVIAGQHFLDRLVVRTRGVDAERLVSQDGEEHDPKNIVVFDDEDAWLLLSHARENSKRRATKLSSDLLPGARYRKADNRRAARRQPRP